MDGPEYAGLVLCAYAGDADAFGALAAEERTALVRVAWTVLGDRHEAEDVVQDALVRAWMRMGQLRDTASFQPWLRRIVLHSAQSRLRASAARRALQWSVREVEALDRLCAALDDGGAADPARIAETGCALTQVQVLLSGLPLRQRQVLLGCVVGESRQETARKLGVSAAAVRVALHRARANLTARMPDFVRPPRPGVARAAAQRGRFALKRSELERRVGAAGLQLRSVAEIIPVGETVDLPSGSVTLECVLYDAGLLLVFWRVARRDGSGPERGIQLSTMPRLWSQTAADGMGCGVLLHPGLTRVPLVFHEALSDGTCARFDLEVPEWDGGAELAAARVLHTPLAVRGYAHGGFGGRLEVVLRPGPSARDSLTLGGTPPVWWEPQDPVAHVPRAVRRPAAPAEAGVNLTPGAPFLWMAGGALQLRHRAGVLAAQVLGQSWNPREGWHETQFGFREPCPPHPLSFVLPLVGVWRRIPPQAFCMRATDRARRLQIPLGASGACLEVRVGSVSRPAPRPEVRGGRPTAPDLGWAWRVRGAEGDPMLASLMARRESEDGRASWFPVEPLAGGLGIDGWCHHRVCLGSDGRATIACTALGTLSGPIELPLPPAAASGSAGDAGALREAAGRVCAPRGLFVAAEAGRAMDRAETDARARGVLYLSPEDLLLGLLHVGDGLGEAAWLAFGLIHTAEMEWAVRRLCPAAAAAAPGQPAIGGRLEAVFQLAAQEASGRSAALTACDLLLGLLREGRSNAALLLSDAGLTPTGVRRAWLRLFEPG